MTKPSRVASYGREAVSVHRWRWKTGPHGIEHQCQCPVQFLTTAGKHDVLLVKLDLLIAITDAMGTGEQAELIE